MGDMETRGEAKTDVEAVFGLTVNVWILTLDCYKLGEQRHM
jgi:hypothetical protein